MLAKTANAETPKDIIRMLNTRTNHAKQSICAFEIWEPFPNPSPSFFADWESASASPISFKAQIAPTSRLPRRGSIVAVVAEVILVSDKC